MDWEMKAPPAHPGDVTEKPHIDLNAKVISTTQCPTDLLPRAPADVTPGAREAVAGPLPLSKAPQISCIALKAWVLRLSWASAKEPSPAP